MIRGVPVNVSDTKGDNAMKQLVIALVLVLAPALLPAAAAQERPYVVKPIVEMKIKQLPQGTLYWRVENFPTLEQAKAAAGRYRWNPDTVSYEGSPALAAEAAGKAWLFTLGAKGGATPGGTKVAEIGPVPPVTAPEYLLRVNHGSGPAGSKTSVHTHPGSEAFYVVAGRLGQKTSHGESHAEAGQTMNGHPADMPMQVFNSGTSDLTALIMFVVDATRPFSTPAKFP
jgi:quercetin dioxygenase-like cupin family protein